MKKFSYHQRLANLKLESLELKQLRADLLFMYKLVFGIIDLKLSDFFYRRFPSSDIVKSILSRLVDFSC